MTELSETILGIVCAGAAASLAARLLPESPGGKSLSRSVCAVLGLLLTVCMIAPLVPALRSLRERAAAGEFDLPLSPEKSADALLRDALEREAAGEIGARLEELIAARFASPPGAVAATVGVRADADGVTLQSVALTLSGRGILVDPRALTEYVREVSGCAEIEILY